LMDQFPPDSQDATASQFTSALAVAVERAMGAATSAPPIAAMVSVLRRFCNIVPFAARAPRQHPPRWALNASQLSLRDRGISRGVPSRSGTTGEAVIPRRKVHPAAGEPTRGICRPHSHAGFVFLSYLLSLETNWTVRTRFRLVTSVEGVSLFDNRQITVQPKSCLCRSAPPFPVCRNCTSMPVAVTQITLNL